MRPTPDFVRTLTIFGASAARRSSWRFGLGDLRQFRPSQGPSKREPKRTKTSKNEPKRTKTSKNGPKSSAFCLTYLNILGPNRPWRPKNADSDAKKRAFGGSGEGQFDVSLMEVVECQRTARPVRLVPRHRDSLRVTDGRRHVTAAQPTQRRRAAKKNSYVFSVLSF